MTEGREIGKEERQGCPLAYTLQHLLGRFNEELFPGHGWCKHRRKKNQVHKTGDDMALLAEDERLTPMVL